MIFSSQDISLKTFSSKDLLSQHLQFARSSAVKYHFFSFQDLYLLKVFSLMIFSSQCLLSYDLQFSRFFLPRYCLSRSSALKVFSFMILVSQDLCQDFQLSNSLTLDEVAEENGTFCPAFQKAQDISSPGQPGAVESMLTTYMQPQPYPKPHPRMAPTFEEAVFRM